MGNASMTETTARSPIPLREPAEQVSPRAVSYWQVSGVLRWLILGGFLLAWSYLVAPNILASLGMPYRWEVVGKLLTLLIVCTGLAWAVLVPPFRYRIHRWELTSEALFTQSGWLNRELRVAPLSRIQTVDSHQSAVMRWFGLTSVIAANASSRGSIEINCLDEATAKNLVAHLTTITAASEGDGA
jgi:uncharacterized protein